MGNNVILLFGGKSFEHDISIITALTIYNRINDSRFNILPVYINKSNEWFFYEKNNLKVTCFKNFDSNWKKTGFKKVYFKEKYMCYKKCLSELKIQIDAVLNC